MYQNLFIGNRVIRLDEIDSTNLYLKELVSNQKDTIEGVVVIADHQTSGRGQMGNKWESEAKENLTFSVLLKPKLDVKNQFVLSQLISLAIVDFLENEMFTNVSIKWPNDIYIDNSKVAGILIENTLKGSQIENTIVGIGLNVNQSIFSAELKNATSMKLEKNIEYDKEEMITALLFFIEKKYLALRSEQRKKTIDETYKSYLYRYQEMSEYEIGGVKVISKIVGVTATGLLQMEMNNTIKKFDLKEIKFVI